MDAPDSDNSSMDNAHFTMTEPGPIGKTAQFGFWFTTADLRLIDFIDSLPCVVNLERSDRDDAPMLVDIGDAYDPDEAWHWIRTDLEDDANAVHLDSIWHEAVKWLL
ncbi:hypothetical protein HC928_05550 [bacterium]|nr:hypothetical protein [bacterium]